VGGAYHKGGGRGRGTWTEGKQKSVVEAPGRFKKEKKKIQLIHEEKLSKNHTRGEEALNWTSIMVFEGGRGCHIEIERENSRARKKKMKIHWKKTSIGGSLNRGGGRLLAEEPFLSFWSAFRERRRFREGPTRQMRTREKLRLSGMLGCLNSESRGKGARSEPSKTRSGVKPISGNVHLAIKRKGGKKGGVLKTQGTQNSSGFR